MGSKNMSVSVVTLAFVLSCHVTLAQRTTQDDACEGSNSPCAETIQDLKLLVQTLQREVSDFNTQLQHLKSTDTAQNQKLTDDLTNLNSVLQEHIQIQDSKENQIQNSVDQVKYSINRQNDQISQLTEKIDGQVLKLNEFENIQIANHQLIVQLNETIISQNQNLTFITNNVNQNRNSVNQVQNSVHSQNDRVRLLAGKLDDQIQRLTEFEKIQMAKNELVLQLNETMMWQNQNLTHIVMSQNNQIGEYESSITRLENVTSSQNKAISELKSMVAELQTAIITTASPYISTTTKPTSPASITGPGDCSEVYRAGRTESGVYTIILQGQTVPVYCDMENGGGWTVFQNRKDGSIDFYRYWAEYKVGFGDLEGEFWWGNDHLATLTAAKQYTLRVDMSDWDGDTSYALYYNFSVAAESDYYRLRFMGSLGTTGKYAYAWSSGEAFSTRDRDNDRSDANCAVDWMEAGGWFSICSYVKANPNGRYGRRGHTGYNQMYWYGWRRNRRALKTFSMRVRPALF